MTDTKPLENETPSVDSDLLTTSRSPLKRNPENEKQCEEGQSSKRPKVVSTPVDTNVSSSAVETKTVVTPTSTSTSDGSKETATTVTAVATKSTAASASTPTKSETLDLAETLGLKAGAQIEVQWEIHTDGKEDEEGDGKKVAASETNDPAEESTSISLHWWKATLLEYDGRTADSVAVRSLLYEARPDLGFPEPSKEDVVFLGKDVLATSAEVDSKDWEKDPDSVRQMPYRRIHNDDNPDEVFYYNDDQLDEQLNALLMGAFQKNQQAWKAVPAAQQAVIAEMIQKKKEELKDVLRAEARHKVITPETIKDILARTF